MRELNCAITIPNNTNVKDTIKAIDSETVSVISTDPNTQSL